MDSANAKGNAQQLCMFESPVRTKSKFTHPSNYVSFTLSQPYWFNIAIFFHPFLI